MNDADFRALLRNAERQVPMNERVVQRLADLQGAITHINNIVIPKMSVLDKSGWHKILRLAQRGERIARCFGMTPESEMFVVIRATMQCHLRGYSSSN